MSNMSRGRKLPDAKPMTAQTKNAASQLGVKAKSMSAETKNDAKRMGLKPKDMMKKPESGGTPQRIRTKNPPGGSETPGEKAKRKAKK